MVVCARGRLRGLAVDDVPALFALAVEALVVEVDEVVRVLCAVCGRLSVARLRGVLSLSSARLTFAGEVVARGTKETYM